MRGHGFITTMAFVGFLGGNLVGYGLSDRELREAMCSYYSERDFCKKEKARPSVVKDLAIMGLSKQLHEVSLKVSSIENKIAKGPDQVLCVKAHRLNIRLYPLDGTVIGIYKRGAKVAVVDRIADWVRTEDGWVSGRYLKECSDEKVAYGSDASPGARGDRFEHPLHGGDTSGTGKAQMSSSPDPSSSSSEVLK